MESWSNVAADLVLSKPLSEADLATLLWHVSRGGPPTSRSRRQASLLDTAYLDAERRALGEAQISALIRTFTRSAHYDLEAAIVALAGGQIGGLGIHFHRLASGAANLGLPRLAERARQLEIRSLSSDRIELAWRLKALAALHGRSCDALLRHIGA